MKRLLLATAFGGFAMTMGACGGGPEPSPADPTKKPAASADTIATSETLPVATPPADPRRIRIARGPIEFLVELESLEIAADGELAAECSLRNRAGEPVLVTFPNGQRFDLVLSEDADGLKPVAAWSQGRMFTMNYMKMNLTAGQAIQRRLDLPMQPPAEGTVGAARSAVAPGNYYLRCVATTNPPIVTPPVAIVVK